MHGLRNAHKPEDKRLRDKDIIEQIVNHEKFISAKTVAIFLSDEERDQST